MGYNQLIRTVHKTVQNNILTSVSCVESSDSRSCICNRKERNNNDRGYQNTFTHGSFFLLIFLSKKDI